ncbi:MAG: glutamate-5-semialdehyde dehydrogenase [Planctomycetes bacterium]|nr:glutamate-5-semialdehyde dehydrogenase [Planctomycetota bacterium]
MTQYITDLAQAARKAAGVLACTTGEIRDKALLACAAALREASDDIQAANTKDLAGADELGLTDAMTKRLVLNDAKVEGMAVALADIAAQVDPVGKTITAYNRPNGLRLEKRRVPIGVIGIVFESRPNVTSDAAGLCLKSGNACILRGGKEAINSNLAIAAAIKRGLAAACLPAEAVTVLETTDRAAVSAMATAEGLIDLIIPRGGHGLIRAVMEAASIPVIKHLDGICHVYVHAEADLDMAEAIAVNAKCEYPAVCNAMETLLVDAAVAETFLPRVAAALKDAGVELRGGDRCRAIIPDMGKATEDDWATEYLDLVLSIRVVDDIAAAVEHINTYGSMHTDAIVTRSIAAAEQFITNVDASSVMVNASTRWADGGRYGLGAEIGISTDKLHARGPMGAEDLTSTKWIVTGQGHVVE